MDKVFVVWGASSDMGMALIKQIGQNYTHLMVQYRHKNDALQAVLDELSAQGVGVRELELDLSVPDAPERIKEAITEWKPELMGKEIHFAHFPMIPQTVNRFHKIRWEVFAENMDVSVRSFVVTAQALLPMMCKSKGKILAMVSWVAQNIPPRYCSDYVIGVSVVRIGLEDKFAVGYAPNQRQVRRENGLDAESIRERISHESMQ